MNDTARPITTLLGDGGPFTDALPGFAPRDAQVALAEAVENTLQHGDTLVAEAGTGIGKTLAYLVPVHEWGGRTIVSTGTKNLQDQLFFKDLPLVEKALGGGRRTALLKGRANYLCIYRMRRTEEEGRLPGRDAVAELAAVRDWSARTSDGDLTRSAVIRPDSSLWPMITSTVDNCLGQQCEFYDRCHVVSARREAQEADIVVVNHHLLFADMAVRQRGFGEVLPGADAFIVDEAHQAPDTAARFFSTTLSARQVNDWLDDLMAEASEVPGALAAVQPAVEPCRQAVKALSAAMAESLPERGSWPQMIQQPDVREALQALDQYIVDMAPLLENVAEASKGLESCQRRRSELHAVFDRLDADEDEATVRWYERRGRGVALHLTPLNVAEAFDEFRQELDAAWVFTSATIAVGEDFSHFTRSMGLDAAETLRLGSPFDYPRNARLWLPDDLPEPREPEFVERLLERVRPVIEASEGRAFLLFTSHRALQRAAALMRDDWPWPLYIQGEQPRSLLLDAFRTSGNGILLGTASFWEGVDVMGDALSLVVIDKLPFAAPDDPVFEARSEQLRRHGGNPFAELSLPQAVIALKQGAGRLIRDVNDRGALVICDKRLKTRSYGRVFIDSLPPMQPVESVDELVAFFEHPPEGADERTDNE